MLDLGSPFQLAAEFLFLSTSFAAVHLDLERLPIRRERSALDSRSIDTPVYEAPSAYTYNINLTIGTPGQPLQIQIDTGSAALFAVGTNDTSCMSDPASNCADGVFNPSKSSTYNLTDEGGLQLYYGDGSDFDFGDLFTDVLTIGSTPIQNVSMGVSYNGTDALGVFGLGFNSDLSYNAPLAAMVDQGIITRAAYGMYLPTSTDQPGSLLFGGIDTAKYTGPLVSMPIDTAENWTTNPFLKVALTSFSLNDASGLTIPLLPPSTPPKAMILDSGTPNNILPPFLYARLYHGLGAVNFTSGGSTGPQLPCALASSNATFTLGFTPALSITIPVSAFIDPEGNYNGETFASGALACSFFAGQSADDSSGLLGDAFLRHAYAVFDLQNRQIALAQSRPNATATSIVEIPSGTGLPGVSLTVSAVAQTAVEAVTTTFVLPGPNMTAGRVSGSVATGFVMASPTFDLGVTISEGSALVESGSRFAMLACALLLAVVNV